MATAGSAAPAGRTGDGNNADGLKTHISTALSGLLDRALGSRAEQGGAHGTPALPAVQKSELAREMHRLIMAPTPARLVLLKASERVAGVDAPEPYPYSCLYCNCGFEHMNTRNRHMGHAHKREMYGRSAMTEKSEDDPDDCEDSDHKSKLPVTGSPTPECPSESGGRSPATAAGASGGPSDSVASGVDSAAGAPADLPCTSARSLCGELPAREEVAVADVTERPEDSIPAVVQTPTSTLARELRRLIRAPAPARLVLQRASERASGVDGPDPYPFPCLYCESRFEQESTCNRHMGRAHPMMVYPDLKWEEMEDDPGGEASDSGWQEPKVSIWTPETPGGDGEVGGDGDFLCSESKPPVAGSRAPECPVEPAGRPVTTGAGTAGGSTVPVATTAVSAAGAPDYSPRAARPPRAELPVREEAAAADGTEEPDASESATGAAASGRGDEARGLKTHISTAFGGLLVRAVGSRLEKGLVPSSPGLATYIPRPERGRRQVPASAPSPLSRGRSRRRIFATDLAKQVRENMSKWSRTVPPTLRHSSDSVPQGDSSRYVCLYCDRRFDIQKSLLLHMKIEHKNEIISSSSKEAETEGNSDDASADEGDGGWQESKVSVWTLERPSEEVGGDDDFLCSESKPLPTGSPPTPECRVESAGPPASTGASEACVPSESSAADSAAAAPTDSTHAPALPLCTELPAADEAAVVDLTEEPEASESATGAAAPVRGDEARGLKTHILTAFGGLLERAVSSRLEKGLIPRMGRRRAPVPSPAPTPAPRGRKRRIYATDLAKRVRQHLSSGQPRTPTPRLRCAADSVPQGDSWRYTCLYCDRRFDFRTSLQWHMKTDHENETVASTLKEEDSEDISDEELPCEDEYCESKPAVEEYPASEWSDIRPDARGAAVPDAGGNSPPRYATAPTAPPCVPPHPDSPTGRDAPPGCSADRHSDSTEGGRMCRSVPSTDPTAATAPSGRDTRSVGLKTQISTALGGLLERAAGTRLEMGFNNLGSHMWHVKHEHKDESIFSELKQTEPGDDASTGGDCGRGWPEQSPANCPVETAGEDTVRIGDYLCSECGALFVTLHELLLHEKEEHTAASAGGRHSSSTETASARDGHSSSTETASARDGHSSSTETVSARDGHSSSTETAVWQDDETDLMKSPGLDADAIFIKEEVPDEMGPVVSPQPEIETIFIKEETSAWESPDDGATARDPLSLEEEVQEDPVVGSGFSGCIKEEPDVDLTMDSSDSTVQEDPVVGSGFSGCIKEEPDVDLTMDSSDSTIQEDPVVGSGFSGCIKEEPDVDLTMDSSDSTEVATRGHTSDITCSTAVPVSTRPSFSKVGGIGQTAAISPPLDNGREEDDTSALGAVTSVGDPVTPFGVADTDGGNTTAGTLGDDDRRPPYCYAELIAMAIENSPDRRAKVTEICAFILNRFPYYRNRKAWQKSIRANLSMHECFIKVYSGRIRNNYWTIDSKYKDMFENGNYRRQSNWSVVSDAKAVSRPHYVADPGHRLQHPSADSQLPVDTEDSGADIGNGDGTVLPFASPHRTRSPPVYDGSNTASFEEQNVQSADHNEVVTEREESTESISCGVWTRDREDNPICGTDNMRKMDSDFPAFTCSSCLQSFSSKYSLIKHVFTHIDRVEPPSHICRDCGEVFSCDDSLNEHSKMRGSGKTGKVCSPSGTSRDETITGNNSYRQIANIDHSQGHCCQSSNCSLCQERSTSLVHKKPYKCNACSKSFAFSCYLRIQKCANMDYRKKPHECEVCGKLFPKVYDLKLHLLVHSGLKSLNCDVCDKLFATVDELKFHSALHCVANSHRCDICDKSFDTLASLKSHVVRHSIVESHKCDDCGKLFARVGKFEFLLSVHSGTKSLVCSVCSKPFKSALNLRRHMHMHT